ncbi:hypothetical protein FQN54_005410 [Arachnomyces sp. PD_36]|nr:hypothetical protein FQN54_005410 [Arachnomyces sp. PD_36]
MYESHKPHPLLAQIPLTVSPFISLPTATTLPYTYKTVPTTLPSSATIDPNAPDQKARYVVSSSGHAAHPDEILASCRALEEDMKRAQADAEKTIREWEESIKQRELAEKRRVAPGWLDRDEKLLQPISAGKPQSPPANSILDQQPTRQEAAATSTPPMRTTSDREGEELDRAFGGLDVK